MKKASISKSQHRQEKMLEASSITLALWQLRKTWRLLLLVGLGMLAAVILVCAVPLYTHVATTVGLRQILASPQSNSTVLISSRSQQISPRIVQTATQDIDASVRHDLSPYLTSSSEFSLEMLGGLSRTPVPSANTDQVQLLGSSMTQASSQVQLIQGRLPSATSTNIEIALTPQEAERMHAKIGDVLQQVFPMEIRRKGIFSAISRSRLSAFFFLTATIPSGISKTFKVRLLSRKQEPSPCTKH